MDNLGSFGLPSTMAAYCDPNLANKKSTDLRKTATQTLYELCNRQNEQLVVVYDETPDPDDKTKTCKVEAFGISGTGCGQSKKEAKHDASADLLTQLAQSHRFKGQIKSIGEVPQTPDDSVSALYGLCEQRKYPRPKFSDLSAVGPPFTYLCEVASNKCMGTNSSKKSAKHTAAQNMLKEMQNNGRSDENKRVATVDTSKRMKKSSPSNFELERADLEHTYLTPAPMRLQNKFFRQLPQANKAKEILACKSSNNKKKVDLMCAVLDFTYNIQEVEDDSEEFIVFSLYHGSDCLFIAKGDEAIFERVFQYLKTMLD